MPTVYITAPVDTAGELAEILVAERLAACVNRVPCISVYRWEGEVIEDDEVILLVKTTDERYSALVDHIREVHPYDVPCIERFDEDDILSVFHEWRDESVADASS